MVDEVMLAADFDDDTQAAADAFIHAHEERFSQAIMENPLTLAQLKTFLRDAVTFALAREWEFQQPSRSVPYW